MKLLLPMISASLLVSVEIQTKLVQNLKAYLGSTVTHGLQGGYVCPTSSSDCAEQLGGGPSGIAASSASVTLDVSI
jgi:hypothetical protein